ncbi:cell division protein FtsB [Candidatus Profftia sp. (ex Adelges kitamiensis)]|uniref:cell division protein FtsB n=1 Tax=Candidatus Profftia sp. (ex Adelges kitamiensis) TaxID=2864218 RepID=UPI001CE340E8|nr:cell division protein FtsB [Candidatus Profftia sp. (ex Adelges kitamiensis)]
MNTFKILLIIIWGWLQYSLWIGKNGMHDYIQIQRDIITQKHNNRILKYRNDKLFAEIDDLSNNQEAIEECARNELGMIKIGEIFYRLVPKQNKHNIITH